MDAYAVKPNPEMPFVTNKPLKRTPASEENKRMTRYFNTHDFSCTFDRETGEVHVEVTEK